MELRRTKPPCVTLVSDDIRLTTFEIWCHHENPEEWDRQLLEIAKMPTTVREVKVSYLDQSSSLAEQQHYLLQLALAIRSHPGNITNLSFEGCTIDDLGPLCVAISPNQPSLSQQRQQQNAAIALKFIDVTFGLRALQCLRLMLKSNSIKTLTLDRCVTKNDVSFHLTLSDELCNNQSLQHVEFLMWPLSRSTVRTGVNVMLTSLNKMIASRTTTAHVLELNLHIHDSTKYWDLFRAVERQNTLQRLQISHSCICLEDMEALMATCLLTTTLEHFHLNHCNIDYDALMFMMRSLSKTKAIDALTLWSVTADDDTGVDERFFLDFSTLQLDKLVLIDMAFAYDGGFAQIMESIANNPHIQCLQLTEGTIDDPANAQVLCNFLLQRNVGPTELEVSFCSDDSTMLVEALQVNTTVKSLTLSIVGMHEEADLVRFAEGLRDMSGLRQLTFQGDNCKYTEEFFHALQTSLEHNHTLVTLSLEGIHSDDAKAQAYLPRIRYLLALNRVGRNRWATADPFPVALWSQVLAKSSQEPDGIYYVLSEQPDMVMVAAPAMSSLSPASRKRNRNECEP